MYFRCRQTERAERAYSQNRDHLSPWMELNDRTEASRLYPGDSITLRKMIDRFSGRQFSLEEDALRAFSGILRRYSSPDNPLGIFQGMPLDSFHEFFNFRARAGSGGLLRRRKEFPSYAWLGWRDALRYQLALPPPATWIKFYIHENGSPQAVCLPNGGKEVDRSVIADRMFRYSPHRSQFCHLEATPPTTHTNAAFRYPLLQFWTFSTHLRLEKINPLQGSCVAYSAHGYFLPRVQLDGWEESSFFEEGGLFEFIVLAESHDKPDLYADSYLAIMVEWQDGIAQRRGIADLSWFLVADSFPPGPTWKAITLG